MDYARRSMAPLLFELRLGFVARGADIGKWGLSQYPSEGEILLPPLTALQMTESRVEKDLVIVTFRPTIAANPLKTGKSSNKQATSKALQQQHSLLSPSPTPTGGDDLARIAKMEAAEQRNRAETAERRAKEMAAKDAEKTWKFAMADTKLKASQRQACELSAQMKVARAKEVGTLMKRASSEAESEKLKGQLESAQAEADAAQKLALAKRAAAERAAELEACASKQLHWALLQSNQRLARARLTDIVKEKDEEEAVAPSAAEPSLSEVEREVVDALNAIEGIIGLLTDPKQRKKIAPTQWDDKLGDSFAKVSRYMLAESLAGSLRVQNLGCCALACLVSELDGEQQIGSARNIKIMDGSGGKREAAAKPHSKAHSIA